MPNALDTAVGPTLANRGTQSPRRGDVYRAEVIGSMLRPPTLLRVREEHRAGRASDGVLKYVEDRAVDECIAVQERTGVDIVTDGEMRRNVFASQLAQSVEGFGTIEGNTVDWFTMDGKKETSPVTVGLVSRMRRLRHLSAE